VRQVRGDSSREISRFGDIRMRFECLGKYRVDAALAVAHVTPDFRAGVFAQPSAHIRTSHSLIPQFSRAGLVAADPALGLS